MDVTHEEFKHPVMRFDAVHQALAEGTASSEKSIGEAGLDDTLSRHANDSCIVALSILSYTIEDTRLFVEKEVGSEDSATGVNVSCLFVSDKEVLYTDKMVLPQV